ncbi:MAG TPA: Zn-dependent alcohol dehydrogenase [Myxococcota bacterium]|nr:Zn-dependent alcohol dehydrogenase [Myxococcota bacterium]
MRAAVLRAYGKPLAIEEVELARPGPRELRVRTVACGICHSDLHVQRGTLPAPLPTVLGHEVAGIVEEVGAEVAHVRPGDRVIGCVSAFCGHCEYCLSGRPNLCGGEATARRPGERSRLSAKGEPLVQFAHLAGFAEELLLHEHAVVKIRDDMPLDRAALIGCGVTTGMGAALRTARIEPGSSVAVVGCGGIGLAALQGSRIAGAGRIVAVDRVPWKLELARKLGATETVDASAGDPVATVQALTGGGVDTAFECIGTPATVQQTVAMARRGGSAVLVGVVPLGAQVPLPVLDVVINEKKILGSMMGGNRFRIDMPRYVDFYLDGRLRLDEMISLRLPLDDVNSGLARLEGGEIARSVIVFDPA